MRLVDLGETVVDALGAVVQAKRHRYRHRSLQARGLARLAQVLEQHVAAQRVTHRVELPRQRPLCLQVAHHAEHVLADPGVIAARQQVGLARSSRASSAPRWPSRARPVAVAGPARSASWKSRSARAAPAPAALRPHAGHASPGRENRHRPATDVRADAAGLGAVRHREPHRVCRCGLGSHQAGVKAGADIGLRL